MADPYTWRASFVLLLDLDRDLVLQALSRCGVQPHGQHVLCPIDAAADLDSVLAVVNRHVREIDRRARRLGLTAMAVRP